ncbi:hypothetical protein SEPCBS119000_003707 [Sporothrix epigloea]|uniref:RBR-type E3 ubiquitin transferase n=1 Tax=Sporothrix epigloea TaxID=1892477 RepID=A0ABP0DN39_9PEZI
MSHDTASTAAPATPATENDEIGFESGHDEDDDTDEEEDENELQHANGIESINTYTKVHGLEWAHVDPPTVLRDIDESDDKIPEILREIVISSIESVQSQLAIKVAERNEQEAAAAAAAAAKAHAEAEAAAEASLVAAEVIRHQQSRSMELQEPPSFVDKGKGRDISAQPFTEPDPATAWATAKPARRHFASRVLRHVHKLSGGGGEGSSTGAAIEAAEAKAAAKAAKAARLARQKAYEEAMLRQFEPNSSASAKAEAGPSKAATLQRAYEEASQTTATKTTSISSMASGALEVDAALASSQRRAAMLFAIVRKEHNPPATIQLVSTALDNEAQFPPKCCLNEVPAGTVDKYIPQELKRRYKLKLDEFATPLNDRVYCPTPDCGVWIPPAHIAAAARTACCRNGHETCTACRQAAHGRGSANREACPEASAQDRRHQELADELAREEGWRHCIRCAVLVEHRDACQHMTCRCGAEFCYVCGLVWRTCYCDMEDLQRIKDEAARRRAQRTEREAREEERVRRLEEAADAELAELRDALSQIAAFEQREREQLRQVQQAQRARLHRLKEDREAALRVEVKVKFAGLRTTLQALNERQSGKASKQRKEQRASLRTAVMEQHSAAVACQEQSCAEASEEAACALRAFEQLWRHDYCIRLSLEKQLESEYEQALTGGLPTPEVRGAEAALKDYQRINDARLDAYCAWRDSAMADARDVIEEARRAKHGEASTALQRQRDDGRQQRSALDRKHAGERIWCRAVAAERMRLLHEMEQLEQELGLAGSTSEVDSNLMLLLELDASGALGNDREDTDVDDTEMSHLYAMMLADAVGDVDVADLNSFGGVAGNSQDA